MKNIICLTAIMAILMSATGCVTEEVARDVLFQNSTFEALLNGDYEGNLTYGELKKHGDFGMGTFNALNGEMIALDGKFYRIKADGFAYPVKDSDTTPFAAVTFFDEDKTFTIKEASSFEDLTNIIAGELPDKNVFYAVRIEGVFDYLKVRSVPEQKKPYPPIAEVIKNQPEFQYSDVKGTMVGFWSPSFVGGITVKGAHLHFITEARSAGGHVLECSMRNVKVTIDTTPNFYLTLPENDA